MKLIGERIIIRDFSFKDDQDYFEYAKNPNVGPNAGWKPVESLELARRLLSSMILSKESFAIEWKQTGRVIGSISIYNYGIRKYNKVKSLGYSLNFDYWGNGIMTEAVKLAIDYVFNKTDCELLEVGAHSDNIPSKRVIEKCGFTFDGTLAKYKKLYDGRVIDADFYSMTKDDYERIYRK